MNTPRPWPKQFYGKAAGCSVVALLMLSACGGGSSESTPISRPATSAAQLADDDTFSVSFAQSVAAGVTEAPEPEAASSVPTVSSQQPTTVSIVDAQAGSATGNVTPTQSQSIPTETTSSNQTAPALQVAEPEQAQTVAIQPDTAEPVTQAQAEQAPVAEQTPTTEPQTQQSTPELATATSAVSKQFSSDTSAGFTGELHEDGTVTVRWRKDPKARGYNVYRQAQYIDTIFGEEWIQTDLYDESYYYEIQAFDFADNLYYIATGLTVDVTGTGRSNPDAKPVNESLLDDYELVFSDEFNGGSLDSTKWNTEYLWGRDLVINSEEQYYVDVNNQPDFGYTPFEFDGESLIIKSIRTPEALKEKANNQPYLSGVITSYDSFKFTYGYVEARAKVPFGKGYWAAFWLLNAYYVDDKPEIDIMEHIGDDQDVVYHTYHYYDADDALRSTKSKPTPGIDFTSDFHTYGVEWKPGTIIFYVDGVEQHRISDPKVSQQDMYIIANTAIGGWWPGSPDETTQFPGEYKIDYIRAYQKTTPYEDFPLFDYSTKVPYADDVPGASPNHRPPFELWPEGYPDW